MKHVLVVDTFGPRTMARTLQDAYGDRAAVLPRGSGDISSELKMLTRGQQPTAQPAEISKKIDIFFVASNVFDRGNASIIKLIRSYGIEKPLVVVVSTFFVSPGLPVDICVEHLKKEVIDDIDTIPGYIQELHWLLDYSGT